jgi:hypothetical protein
MKMPGAAAHIAQMHNSSRVGSPRYIDVQQSREYRQRTEITGEDPLYAPGARAQVPQVQARKRTSGSSPGYWQRTEITGVDPLDPSGIITHTAEEDEASHPPGNVNPVSTASELAGGLGSPVSTAQETGESVFYTALGGAERATIFDRLSMGDKLDELRATLGLRTSADLYESSQKEHEERWQLRARRRRMDERPSSDGLEHRASKRVRLVERGEGPSESANGGE